MSDSLDAFGFPLFIIPVDNSFSLKNPANTLTARASFNSTLSTKPNSNLDSPKELIILSTSLQNGSRSCPIYNESRGKRVLNFTSVLKEGWEKRIAKMRQEQNSLFLQNI